MTGSRQQPEPTPSGLGLAGKRLWRRITAQFDLRVDELILLEQAANVSDTLAALEVAMKGQPLVVVGSMQQLREHPLLSESRQQRAQLGRFLAQLRLPDEDGLSTTSTKARAAAKARWSRRSGA